MLDFKEVLDTELYCHKKALIGHLSHHEMEEIDSLAKYVVLFM